MVAKKTNERKDEEVREDVRDEENVAANESPAVRNPLWQSGNVSTNEPGPTTEEVSSIFAEARAAALGAAVDAVESGDQHPDNVVLPEDNDDKSNDEAVADLKGAADDAQADFEEKKETGGLIAETSGDDADSADAKSDADKADEAKRAAGDHK